MITNPEVLFPHAVFKLRIRAGRVIVRAAAIQALEVDDHQRVRVVLDGGFGYDVEGSSEEVMTEVCRAVMFAENTD